MKSESCSSSKFRHLKWLPEIKWICDIIVPAQTTLSSEVTWALAKADKSFWHCLYLAIQGPGPTWAHGWVLAKEKELLALVITSLFKHLPAVQGCLGPLRCRGPA